VGGQIEYVVGSGAARRMRGSPKMEKTVKKIHAQKTKFSWE